MPKLLTGLLGLYILHTLSFRILLPHIVVISPDFDIKTSRLFVVLDIITARWDQSDESISFSEAEELAAACCVGGFANAPLTFWPNLAI